MKELTGGHLVYFYMKCCPGKCLLQYNVFFRYPPFYDANPYDIYRRIAIGYYEFPACISMPGR